jgi:hypothetical protein
MGHSRIVPNFRQSIFPVHQADLRHPSIATRYARTPAGCEQEITGNTTMITNRKIALAAAVILGAASAALANDSGENHQDENRSVVSVGKSANASGAYGYAAAPIHKQRAVREQTESR